MTDRRRPITAGSRVEHIDRRTGIVESLISINDLPGAVVLWDSGPREAIALGYLSLATAEMVA